MACTRCGMCCKMGPCEPDLPEPCPYLTKISDNNYQCELMIKGEKQEMIGTGCWLDHVKDPKQKAMLIDFYSYTRD